jgi:hypothetical protein
VKPFEVLKKVNKYSTKINKNEAGNEKFYLIKPENFTP